MAQAKHAAPLGVHVRAARRWSQLGRYGPCHRQALHDSQEAMETRPARAPEKDGGQGWIRTSRSFASKATALTVMLLGQNGAPDRIYTCYLPLKRRMLICISFGGEIGAREKNCTSKVLNFSSSGVCYSLLATRAHPKAKSVLVFTFVKRKFTDASAVEAIKDKSLCSVSAVLKKLGMPPESGSTHRLIRTIATKYGLDTSHWLGQAWARGIHESKKSDADYFCIRKARISGEWLLKSILRRGLATRQCNQCKLTTWMKKPIPIEVHHINGNPLDNRIQNLEVLCCNCHALTPNFGRKNRV